MNLKHRFILLFIFLPALLAGRASAIGPEHVIAVTILKADLAGRSFVAKTLDGTEHTFHFSPQAPISSLAEAAISKSLYGGEGYQFLIHYTIERREQIVTGFDYVGREAWKTMNGTIVNKNPLNGTITLRTADGKEIPFGAGKHCTIEMPQGAMSFAQWASSKTEENPEVVVRYTDLTTGHAAQLIEFQTKKTN